MGDGRTKENQPRNDGATKPRAAGIGGAAKPVAAAEVRIRLPALRVTDAYCGCRIDLGNLSPRRALAYRMLWDGLVAEGAVMADGRVVSNQTQVDAIRWLLDQIADAAEI